MEVITQLMDVFLHLDVHLNAWITVLGPWIYALVFLIVFCETGLVVTPFLPGDSLLFALGALSAIDGSILSYPALCVLLITAGILGDTTNYFIGRYLGPRVFHSSTSKLLNREHLMRTKKFYEKHGGKTIIIAQYMPIIRTFAPFVAGVGQMRYLRFGIFNVIGVTTWVMIFLTGGHLFGNLPAIRRNFHIVVLAIIVISLLPVTIEFIKARLKSGRSENKENSSHVTDNSN